VSFAAITLCIASQLVFIVVNVYFILDLVRKLLDTLSYMCVRVCVYAYCVCIYVHMYVCMYVCMYVSIATNEAAHNINPD